MDTIAPPSIPALREGGESPSRRIREFMYGGQVDLQPPGGGGEGGGGRRREDDGETCN